ncbi:hypothetical protein [Erythrobacter sp. YT30]|uniref:hypothetical protein n=1 Tax=Erythrobacter sp. YT30 TaxID=1735012 RepID=UPI00076CAE32|nr:hypothetical protein [Erythrobacter sp. YT30]KWV92758.1 hypothetical protein AUC45_00900 [Erythrobacter sp. YT30]
MNRLIPLAAATAAMSVASAANAQPIQDRYALQVVEVGEFEGGAAYYEAQQRLQMALLSPRSRSIPRSGNPQLVSFDGSWEFLKTSRRLRIWRPDVAYTLTVGADGEVTSCEITEKFRRTYVNQKLCDVLSKHHHFEPAHDSNDAPMEGEYTSSLNYLEMRKELGE